MAGLSLQKRLAAEILGVGLTKVCIDKEHTEDVKNAVTRTDIKRIISKGYITVKRGKIKKPVLYPKKKKTGVGRRKGSKGARLKPKRRWINTIRPIRRMLKELKDSKKIDSATYRRAYKLAKGGSFRSRAHLKLYLQQKGVSVEEKGKV